MNESYNSTKAVAVVKSVGFDFSWRQFLFTIWLIGVGVLAIRLFLVELWVTPIELAGRC